MSRSPENAAHQIPASRDAEAATIPRRKVLETGLRALLASLLLSTGCGGFPIVPPNSIAGLENNQRKTLEEQRKKDEQALFEAYRKEVESRGSRLLTPQQMIRIKPGTTVEASLMASQEWHVLIITERNTGETWVLHYHDKTPLSPVTFKPCEDLALTLIGHDAKFESTIRRLGIEPVLIRKLTGGSESHDRGVKITITPCEITKTEINKKEGWINRFTAPGYEVCVTEADSFYPYSQE